MTGIKTNIVSIKVHRWSEFNHEVRFTIDNQTFRLNTESDSDNLTRATWFAKNLQDAFNKTNLEVKMLNIVDHEN